MKVLHPSVRSAAHVPHEAKQESKRTAERVKPKFSADRKTLSIRIPLKLSQLGGRKLIITPAGEDPWQPRSHPPVSAFVKAIARAFRWRKLLETGVYTSIEEMAVAEKINPSYVSRVLRLTLLAPEIIEAALEGKQNDGLQIEDLMSPFPMEWRKQSQNFKHIRSANKF